LAFNPQQEYVLTKPVRTYTRNSPSRLAHKPIPPHNHTHKLNPASAHIAGGAAHRQAPRAAATMETVAELVSEKAKRAKEEPEVTSKPLSAAFFEHCFVSSLILFSLSSPSCLIERFFNRGMPHASCL